MQKRLKEALNGSFQSLLKWLCLTNAWAKQKNILQQNICQSQIILFPTFSIKLSRFIIQNHWLNPPNPTFFIFFTPSRCYNFTNNNLSSPKHRGIKHRTALRVEQQPNGTDSYFQQKHIQFQQYFTQFISLPIHNNMSQYNLIMSSIVLEKQQNSVNSSQPGKSPKPGPIHTTVDLSADQTQKNRRWSERQHILYILFLEENREKIKSKLIRRSNSFFKEMAAFIDSKSSTQCRSYHQKYQTKYKFPHRIIREEREKLDQGLYKGIAEEFAEKCRRQADQGQNRCNGNHGGKVKREAVETAEYECQTTIQGVSTIFIQPDQPAKQICQDEPQPFSYSLLNYPFLNYYYPHHYYLH